MCVCVCARKTGQPYKGALNAAHTHRHHHPHTVVVPNLADDVAEVAIPHAGLACGFQTAAKVDKQRAVVSEQLADTYTDRHTHTQTHKTCV